MRLFILFLFAMSLMLLACKREKFNESSEVTLEFSRDTILFDTVFSTIGSTTRAFTVHNNFEESITISEIVLEGGYSSQFRFNIDGLDGPQASNVEILPGDSVYVFVEVTVDPGNSALPFVISDRIRFKTNGNLQYVQLEAWGQDAHFHGGLNSCGQPFSYIIESGTTETWGNDKPHVIYGIIAIDENATLRINAGTQVYCHAKSGIYAYKSSLIVDGDPGSPVVFQGDRLEPEYDNIPGQWGIQLDCPIETGVGPAIASIIRGGIWIYQSPSSTIEYAVIKNGNMGIQVDTTGVDYALNDFSVKIENTQILNMAGHGLWGQGGSIAGKNLLIGNCGQCCAFLSIGGKYQMDNCTFGNYWSDNSRTMPAFALNNYYKDINENINVRQLVNCSFNNCIMYGNNAQLSDFSEFVVDVNTDVPNSYIFRNCLVDTDENVEDSDIYDNMTNNQFPSLCDPVNYNFRLSAGGLVMSGSFDFANFLDTDLDGNSWGSLGMWKGCYAYDSGSPCQ